MHLPQLQENKMHYITHNTYTKMQMLLQIIAHNIVHIHIFKKILNCKNKLFFKWKTKVRSLKYGYVLAKKNSFSFYRSLKFLLVLFFGHYHLLSLV